MGTFTSWDGHEEIVKLANSFPEYNFLMVGDGPNHDSSRKAPSNMTFTGYVNYADLENTMFRQMQESYFMKSKDTIMLKYHL